MEESIIVPAKRAKTYIGLGLCLTVVGFGAGDLGGWIHLVLQLGDFVCQVLQGLHDFGSVLRFHPSVLLQAVYQGLEEEKRSSERRKGGKRREKEREQGEFGKDETSKRHRTQINRMRRRTARGAEINGLLRPVLPSDIRSVSVASLASSFSCPAGVLMPPKRKKQQYKQIHSRRWKTLFSPSCSLLLTKRPLRKTNG